MNLAFFGRRMRARRNCSAPFCAVPDPSKRLRRLSDGYRGFFHNSMCLVSCKPKGLYPHLPARRYGALRLAGSRPGMSR